MSQAPKKLDPALPIMCLNSCAFVRSSIGDKHLCLSNSTPSITKSRYTRCHLSSFVRLDRATEDIIQLFSQAE